jgi:predicted patatin/cPLA2 family phospholipase
VTTAPHPVVELLRERAAGGRRDPHRVALVLEGGGMRGVVSAGMAAAVERLGLTGCFDLVVGSSAGALNAAALLAGVAGPAAAAYHTAMATREFVNPLRLLFGRPALDVRFVLAHASTDLDPDRHERTVHSPVPLHCLALDVDSAQTVDFTGMRTKDDLWDVLLASTRMPWVGGEPVEIHGHRYLDGGLVSPIPVATAVAAGATHVLVLQTRPYGVPRSSGSRIAERMIARRLARLNPALVPLWHGRVAAYEELVADLARRSSQPDGPPYVLGLRPPAGTPVVAQLERRPDVLARAAADAERLVEDVLGAEPAPMVQQ